MNSENHTSPRTVGDLSVVGGSAVWPEDHNLPQVAQHMQQCGQAWEPDVRLIGNCRADDIAAIAADYLRIREGIACAANALTDSILCSGNDAATNMHFVRKLKALLSLPNAASQTDAESGVRKTQ